MRDELARRLAQIVRPEAAKRWQPRNWWDDDDDGPAAPRVVDGAERARVYVYQPIDSWGGSWGIAAKDMVPLIHAITAPAIDLHINTPGGEVWEAWAIMNALRSHGSRVTAYVDGVAASAGSVIMLAGDEIVMAEASQVYIHDAHGFAFGDEAALLVTAGELGQMSQQIAGLYAQRGGTVDDWRMAMRANNGEGTWYTPDGAVKAGLADRVDVVTGSLTPGQGVTVVETAAMQRFRARSRATIVRANVPAQLRKEVK